MSLTPADYRKTAYIHRAGLAADKPAATDVLEGTLYFSTDTGDLERSDGAVWSDYVNPYLMYTNVHNVMTEDQQIYKNSPTLYFKDDLEPVDSRVFRYRITGQNFYIQAINDMGTITTTTIVVDRTGNLTAELGALIAATGFFERSRVVALGEWQSYSPSWVASGVAPAIGNGTLAGKYTVVGKTVHFSIQLSTGSTTTFGTGTWAFSPPLAMAGNYINGTVFIHGASYFVGVAHAGSWFSGAPVAGNIAAMVTDPATNTALVTDVFPFAWATANYMFINGTYETT